MARVAGNGERCPLDILSRMGVILMIFVAASVPIRLVLSASMDLISAGSASVKSLLPSVLSRCVMPT